MKRHAAVLAVLMLALLTPSLLQAQETQVPLDQAGQLDEIDRELARRLGLFLDRFPDLRFVRLYQENADSYTLEVTFQRDGRTGRHRVPMTDAEVRELRARISTALAASAPEIVLNQDGRFLLLGTTTNLGLGYYGWAVPHILDIRTGRGELAAYMLTAGASFVGPYLYTRDRPVTYGMANAGLWGATRGTLHGFLLAGLIDPTPNDRTANALSMGASLAEALAGYTWAARTDMTAGDAHVIGNYSDFGFALVGYTLITLQPREERVSYGALLAGAGTGLALGTRRAPLYPYTWGDAEIQRTAFYLGAANTAVAWDLFLGNNPSDDDIRVMGPFLAVGSIGGLLLADRALEGHDFSAGQAILVDLGTIAGGLLGMGVAVLVGPDEFDDPTGLFILGALGADLGFVATYASLSDNARPRASPEQSRFGLQLNPAALATLHPALNRRPAAPIPFLSLHFRF